jgi:hypothetical protein
VNRADLTRAFERLERQDVRLDRCAIDVSGARAEATCTGTAQYVPRIGNRTLRVERREWRFSLAKEEAEWLIQTVRAR